MVELRGVVEKLIFRNEENGYTVAKILSEEESFVIVGNTLGLNEGSEYILEGEFNFHERFGEQFSFQSIHEVLPSTTEGIIRYLKGSKIPHIKEAMAKRIVDRFKEDTLRILKEEPTRLLEISGIGEKTFEDILSALKSQENMSEVLIALSEFNITGDLALRIYREYKDQAIDTIRKNPYDMIGKIPGIGFKRADEIAISLGFKRDSEFRKIAGLKYVLLGAAASGHCYLPFKELLEEAKKLLKTDEFDEDECLRALAIDDNFFVHRDEDGLNCYSSYFFRAENYVAGKLKILNIDRKIDFDAQKKLAEVEKRRDIILSKNQRLAVLNALTKGVFVITGGPGTGKTTVLKVLIDILEADKRAISLCAPTGRAAKRMQESSGREAFTIHKLLKIGHSEDKLFFEGEKLQSDVVIVDEVSMVDILLMETLLKSMDEGMQLILVGDADQLPSVGAGNVLSDIINSNVIENIHLDEIFRQTETSEIVKNAHLINRGEEPKLNVGDFFMISERGPSKALEIIKDLVTTRLSNYYGYSPEDIQVLTPVKKGELGVENLNRILQRSLNKSEESFKYADNTFKLGDRVMQIKNNYELNAVFESEFYKKTTQGVFNGDLGYVSEIFEDGLEVTFDGMKKVKYERENLRELKLSYAMTIHKSQGSEFPVVVIPLQFVPPLLATRNLIYTAITRARELVVIVGNYETLIRMIKNDRTQKRYSKLKEKLK